MTFQDWCLSHKEDIRKQFIKELGYNPNLDNPKTFCEKLNWLKIYDSTFLKTYCADKLLVRDYVKSKLGVDLSIPVLGVYNKFEEIDFSKLPKNYVIKCNHGSGMNIIVKDGIVNKNSVKSRLDAWMNTDYLHLYEFHYKPIQKKIFIEEYKDNGVNGLIDYKFWCFNGEPKFYGVNAGHGHGAINYYDLNNKPFYIQRADYPPNNATQWKVPEQFNTMVEYSKKLSEDFKFVRVDFYEINGKIYLGELTFIPGGGYIKYKGNGDEEIGKMLDLQ
jgi:hypothetical protein